VELHSLMGATSSAIRALAPLSDRWDVAVNYYARFAVACSPMAFALFGVWAATLSRVSRRVISDLQHRSPRLAGSMVFAERLSLTSPTS
jgi:hypothetical protein